MTDHGAALPAGSVLHGLAPFAWDSKNAVRYEVALEMLCQQIAAATTRIADEHDQQQPDRALVAELGRLQDELIHAQEGLGSHDQQAIGAVLANAGDLLDAIRSR